MRAPAQGGGAGEGGQGARAAGRDSPAPPRPALPRQVRLVGAGREPGSAPGCGAAGERGALCGTPRGWRGTGEAGDGRWGRAVGARGR